MPVIQRYQPGQVRQQGAPLSPMSVKAADTGVGGATVDLGNAVFKQGQNISADGIAQIKEMEDRKNKAAAKDAFVRFGDGLRNISTELRTKKMRDAIGSTTEGQKSVDKLIQEVAGGLENDTQRELFDSLAQTRRGSFLDGQATYEAEQLRQWEAQSSDAIADEAIDYAVENYASDPRALEMARTSIDIAVETAMVGADENMKRSLKEKKMTQLHIGVINDMSVKNAAEAKKYYEDHKEEIDGLERAKVENHIKELGVKQASQTNAINIFSPGKTLTQMQAEVDKLPSDERDATMQYIKERYNQFKIDRDESERRAINDAWEIVTNNPTLDSIPVGVPGQHKKYMIDYVEAKQKAALKKQADIETDWDEYYRLKRMPHDEFVKVDLLKVKSRMSDTEFKDLVNLQVNEKKEQRETRVRTLNSMANDALEAVGLVEQKKNKGRSDKRKAFFEAFESEVSRFEENGKKITNEDATKILDNLLIKQVEKSWYQPGDDVYTFEVKNIDPSKLPEGVKWSEKYNSWVKEYNGQVYKYIPDEEDY